MTDNIATDSEKINLLWKKCNTSTNVNQNSDEFGGELLQFRNTFSVDNLLNKSVPNVINVTQDQLNNRFEQQGNRMTFNNSNNNTNNNAGSAIANTPTSSMPSTNTDNNVTNNNLKSEESTFVKPDFNSQELMTITIKAR